MSVKLKTVQDWLKDQPKGHFGLELSEDQNFVTKIKCNVCCKHKEVLKTYRNFNENFISGISGSALKKDNVMKHISKSEQHRRALDRESCNQPRLTPLEVYTHTAIG